MFYRARFLCDYPPDCCETTNLRSGNRVVGHELVGRGGSGKQELNSRIACAHAKRLIDEIVTIRGRGAFQQSMPVSIDGNAVRHKFVGEREEFVRAIFHTDERLVDDDSEAQAGRDVAGY